MYRPARVARESVRKLFSIIVKSVRTSHLVFLKIILDYSLLFYTLTSGKEYVVALQAGDELAQ